MLVVLAGAPLAAPLEAFFREKAVAKVAALYFVGEISLAGGVFSPFGRGNAHLSTATLHMRVVQRVYVDGHSHSVL